MILYRPTGLHELRLVYESGMRRWPPRLPEQPIFYPVLNFGYAEQIARDWNAKSRPFVGYVIRFEVEEPYASRFDRHIVGGREHEELWVPAEQLDEFSGRIVGFVEMVAAYFGSGFRGLVPEDGKLAGLGAAEQLARLRDLAQDPGTALRGEVEANHAAIFLHFPFWEQGGSTELDDAERTRTLRDIRTVWDALFPEMALVAT